MGDDVLKIPILIIYDISIDVVRDRLAKELLLYGIRTQKSLFEAEVTEGELKKIQKIVDRYASMDKNDIVSLYIMEPDAYNKTVRMGDVMYLEIDDFII